MSFLGDLFSNAWQGLTGSASAGARGLDDLAHGDVDSFTNEGENSFRELARVPGTSASTLRGLYQGANGDLDWNPYSQNNSVFDQAAGGGASEDPRNRAIGRTIGTMAGTMGLGYLVGPAAGGAIMGGAKAAGEGGNSSEIWQGAARGGASSYLGSQAANADLAGSAGITDTTYNGIANGAIGGVVSTATTPGTNSKDIALGGLYGGLSGGLQAGNKGDVSNMDDLPGSYTARDANGELIPSSSTTNGFIPAAYGGQVSTTQSQKDQNPFSDYIDRALGFFKQPDGSWNGARIDQTINGLMGLYGGYQRKRAADQFMRGLSGRRSAYEENMRNELARKDAAAGRRSAYDTRAVELNSRLAALDAQQAPALMSAQNSSLAGMFNMLQSGYGMARNYGAFDTPIQTQNFQLQPLQLQQPYQTQHELTPDNFSLAGYTPRLKNKGYVGDY